MNRLLAFLFVGFLLNACATNADSNRTVARTTSSGTASATASKSDTKLYNDPNSPLYRKSSVYFALDEYALNSAHHSIVEAHARYLKQNPGRKVTIEGHADELGSREYNLALGQKRAYSVKQSLSLLGVPDTQLDTASWGEERPLALEHNEAAWEKNRRADFVYGR